MNLKSHVKFDDNKSVLDILKLQPSHQLYVFSNPMSGGMENFIQWFCDRCLYSVLELEGVLSVQGFQQLTFDTKTECLKRLEKKNALPEGVTSNGESLSIGYQFLGIYELAIDGAKDASELINGISAIYKQEESVDDPATWLYYPSCPKVGRAAKTKDALLTIAFANPKPGSEAMFREWYDTEHIRHALNIEGCVSGQRFERTKFQQPGSSDVLFHSLAVYEQESTPKEFVDSALLHLDLLKFSPSVGSPFTEWMYRPLSPKLVSNVINDE